MISFLKLLNLGSSPVGKVEITDCNSIAELRAINTGNNGYGVPSVEDGSIVNVDGYYSQNDGGGGVFMFSAYSSATDDGGLTIAPTVGLGRWIRQMSSEVNVRWFGAKGDGVTNDTVALQAALNSGFNVFIPRGSFACVGLTLTGTQITVRGAGGFSSTLVRRANGVILSVSGYGTKLRDFTLRGPAVDTALTGDNLSITAADVDVINVFSYWTLGRALKSIGSATSIRGGQYTTLATGGSDYDIELGVNGTATLYHFISNIRTTTATGGILMTDTGSVVIQGSQFGKLTIAAGTLPAGVNGGMYSSNRILGNVTVDLSGAIFSGNQFGAIAVVLALSGHSIDLSNSFQAGATVTNNGNDNVFIARQISAGSFPVVRYGDDVNFFDVSYDIASKILRVHSLRIDNDTGVFQILNAGGTVGATLGKSAGGNVELVNLDANTRTQMSVTGATSLFNWIVNGVSKLRADVLGVYLGGTTCFDTQGAGSPEGVVTAPIGSTYRRTDGGAVTSFYVKESGAGNTGWVAK